MSILKVGCLQLKLNKTNNIEHIIQSIDKAYKDCPKLDLIVLSELAVGGAGAKDSEHTLDKYVNLFSKIAKDKSIWLIPGSFYEKVNDKIYNTAPVFNPDGKLVTKAKKYIHGYHMKKMLILVQIFAYLIYLIKELLASIFAMIFGFLKPVAN